MSEQKDSKPVLKPYQKPAVEKFDLNPKEVLANQCRFSEGTNCSTNNGMPLASS